MTAKADRVKELMAHPELQEGFKNLKDFYTQMLVDAAPMAKDNFNVDVMLDIKRMLHLTEQLENDLLKMIQVGNVADFKANQPTWLGDLRDGRTGTDT